ncbi:MAG: argininosuccinate lyase [Dehalococcoidia bacterium]
MVQPERIQGRLRGSMAPEVGEEMMAGYHHEQARHFPAYMRVHRAHTAMLTERGIISAADGAAILRALVELEAGGIAGLGLSLGGDDLYLTTEARLTERIGADVGGRMHTGRSRNDLDATVTRLAVRGDGQIVLEAALELAEAALARAEQHTHTIMPGYTHLQHAQPITLGHWLLAHVDIIAEDIARIEAALDRANRSPLGAAALAGTGFPIDRERTAALLGFDGLVENTLVGVSSRAYALEMAAALAILATNISRLGAELMLWTTEEFAYAEVDDAYAGTSSIMPQKKNPLVLEAIKARAGTLTTDAAAMMEIFRALPLGWNFDIYEHNAAVARAGARPRPGADAGRHRSHGEVPRGADARRCRPWLRRRHRGGRHAGARRRSLLPPGAPRPVPRRRAAGRRGQGDGGGGRRHAGRHRHGGRGPAGDPRRRRPARALDPIENATRRAITGGLGAGGGGADGEGPTLRPCRRPRARRRPPPPR